MLLESDTRLPLAIEAYVISVYVPEVNPERLWGLTITVEPELTVTAPLTVSWS